MKVVSKKKLIIFGISRIKPSEMSTTHKLKICGLVTAR